MTITRGKHIFNFLLVTLQAPSTIFFFIIFRTSKTAEQKDAFVF